MPTSWAQHNLTATRLRLGAVTWTLLLLLSPLLSGCESQADREQLKRDLLTELEPILRERIAADLKASLKAELREEMLVRIGTEVQAVRRSNQSDGDPTLAHGTLTPPRSGDAQARAAAEATTPEHRALQPPQTRERDNQGLIVPLHVIATTVVQRRPEGVAEAFSVKDGTLYCFVEATNLAGPERVLTVRWVHNSGITQTYELSIGRSAIWRTWAKLNLTSAMAGQWRCDVFNESGQLLSSAAFIVCEGDAPCDDATATEEAAPADVSPSVAPAQ